MNGPKNGAGKDEMKKFLNKKFFGQKRRHFGITKETWNNRYRKKCGREDMLPRREREKKSFEK